MQIKNITRFTHIALLSVIVIGQLFAYDDYPTTIYTPYGSVVPDTYITEEMSQYEINYQNWWVGEVYPNADLISTATRTYNCHGYAWHVSEGGSNVWIGYSTTTAEDIYWEDGSYTEVETESAATKVNYPEDNHSLVTTGTANYYDSKWGTYPLMYHHKDNCPYDNDGMNYYANLPPAAPQNLELSGGFLEHPALAWRHSMRSLSI